MSAKFCIPKPTYIWQEVPGQQSFALYQTADGETLKWSGTFPLPDIGTKIYISMNSIGDAIVKGYFAEEGYVGVMAIALDPPAWLVSQRKRNLTHKRATGESIPTWIKEGQSTVFGSEIREHKTDETNKTIKL